MVSRNVAATLRPPKVERTELEILSAEQIAEVLGRLEGHTLHPIVALALGTGMRRGEICGLAWGELDLDGAMLRVERLIAAGLDVVAVSRRIGHASPAITLTVYAHLFQSKDAAAAAAIEAAMRPRD
jgi:integrase